jgi:hypothetical protein
MDIGFVSWSRVADYPTLSLAGVDLIRARTGEPLARVQDFLGTQRSLLYQFFYLFYATGLSVVNNMCIQGICVYKVYTLI